MANDFLKMVSVVQLPKRMEDSATVWGKVPANPIQVTQAFSNDPADRPLQDAGFDGLDDEAEARKFQAISERPAAPILEQTLQFISRHCGSFQR